MGRRPCRWATPSGRAQTFINKGVNGRWRDTLSVLESAVYEQRAMAELGEPCVRWLATGA
jgi:aryl sulfotransferase